MQLNDAVSEEHHTCSVSRKIAIPAHTQAAVLVNWYGAGLMKIETHRNILKPQCSQTARGPKIIQNGNPFHIYRALLLVKPTSSAKIYYSGSASSAPTCVIHANDGELHMLIEEGSYR